MATQRDVVSLYSSTAEKYSDIQEIQIPKGEVAVEDIGDGYVNEVYRIKAKNGNKSMIMKYSPPYLKFLGASYPLSTHRAVIQFEAMKAFDAIYPGSVPKPYVCDTELQTTLMEDLRDFEVMRVKLAAKSSDMPAIESVARMVGRVHQATHISMLSSCEFQKLLEKFKNDGMNRSMSHVFLTYKYEEAFSADRSQDSCPEDLQKAIKYLFDNSEIQAAVGKLKSLYCTKKECLIHGDLQAGSYMVQQGIAKMIDLECAFIGCPSFDLGYLLASYISAHHGYVATFNPEDSQEKNNFNMVDACQTTVQAYLEEMTASVGDRQQYVETLISEMAGFAAVHLVGRVVRNIQNTCIAGVPEAEMAVMKAGLNLLESYKSICDIDSLLQKALMI